MDNIKKDGNKEAQLNMKVSSEVKERFMYMVNALGYEKFNQDALENIMSILSKQMVLEGREKYSCLVKTINEYMVLISNNIVSLIGMLDSTEERIGSKYAEKEAENTEIIANLKEKLEGLTKINKDEGVKNQALQNEKEQIIKELSELRKAKEASDKALEFQQKYVTGLESRIASLELLGEQLDETKSKLKVADDKVKELEQTLKDYKRDVSEEVKEEARKAEKERDKAVAEIKSEYQQIVDQLREELRKNENECQETKVRHATEITELSNKHHQEVCQYQEKYEGQTNELMNTRQLLSEALIELEKCKK